MCRKRRNKQRKSKAQGDERLDGNENAEGKGKNEQPRRAFASFSLPLCGPCPLCRFPCHTTPFFQQQSSISRNFVPISSPNPLPAPPALVPLSRKLAILTLS